MQFGKTTELVPFLFIFMLPLGGCDNPPPTAVEKPTQVVVEKPKVVVKTSRPDVVIAPDVVPEEVDEPGTLYTWEDAEGNLHMTQQKPPKGAKLLRKEAPRKVVASDDKGTRAASKKTGQNEAKKGRGADMGNLALREINKIRRDTVAAARHFESFEKNLGGIVASELRASRRKMVPLKEHPLLRENLLGGREQIKKKVHAKRLSLQWSRQLRSPADFDAEVIGNAGLRAKILDPAFRYVAVACPQNGDFKCQFAFAEGVSRR